MHGTGLDMKAHAKQIYNYNSKQFKDFNQALAFAQRMIENKWIPREEMEIFIQESGDMIRLHSMPQNLVHKPRLVPLGEPTEWEYDRMIGQINEPEKFTNFEGKFTASQQQGIDIIENALNKNKQFLYVHVSM